MLGCHWGALNEPSVLELLCATDSALNLNASQFFMLEVGKKSQIANMLGFAGNTVSVATTQLCQCVTEAAIDDM